MPALVAHVDVLPTLCELAGEAVPPVVAARLEGRWSLVNTRNRPDSWELHDIAADPGERTNVAAEHPDVAARLTAEYDRWWAAVQDDLVNEDLDGPVENPFKAAYRRQFGE